MDFSVATNFDGQLLERLEGFPVREVFGKLPRDIVGGGRASYMLGRLSRRQLVRHVAAAGQRGIRFNYLLNSACLGNREFNRGFERRLLALLDWLVEIGVGAVTVALPSLLEIVKRRHPSLYVRVGVFARVDSVAKAQAWEDLGADGITLDPLAVNRNLDVLESIHKAVQRRRDDQASCWTTAYSPAPDSSC
jgi:collagenase-like PrtC family protease